MSDIRFAPLDALPEPAVGTAALPVDAELEALREAARAEGHAEGLQIARQQTALAIQALAAAETQRAASLTSAARRLEDEAVDLAVDLAQALVEDHLVHDPQVIRRIVAGALDAVVDAERARVDLHPSDLELLSVDMQALAPAGLHVTWQANAGVQPGGCYVHTDSGDVDATRVTRLSRLTGALEQARRDREHS